MLARRRGTSARALLAPGVLGAALAAAGCAVVAGAVVGRGSLGAVGLGSALVLGFLLVGQLPLARATGAHRGLAGMLLLVGYTARIALLLVAFRLVVTSGFPDRQVLGGTVVVVGLGWTAGTVVSFLRWRPPVVDLELASYEQRPGRG